MGAPRHSIGVCCTDHGTIQLCSDATMTGLSLYNAG